MIAEPGSLDEIAACLTDLEAVAGIACLSADERLFLFVYDFHREAAAGGLAQFFFSTRDRFEDTHAALRALGLPLAAEALRQTIWALAAPFEPYSLDHVSATPHDLSSEKAAELDRISREYLAREEDVLGPLRAFAAARGGDFRTRAQVKALAQRLAEERQVREDLIRGLDREWKGKERTCPLCGTTFRSIRDRGQCPNCRHVFHASDPEHPHDYPYGGEWDFFKPGV